MHEARTTFWILTAGTALALTACGDPVDDPSTAGTDAGPTMTLDAGPSPDTGPADATCQPLTCLELGDVCGPQSDGCGGVLDCRPCECTPETFADDCPSRACQTATGCEAGQCTYDPVTCGGEVCGVPEADGDSSPRACGDALCPAQYCDPSPTMGDDGVTFANRCVPLEEVACGTCGLGRLVCDDGGPECRGAPPLYGLDPEQVSCTEDPMTSTFVFVDPAATATVADGTRSRPFADFQSAMDAAVIGSKRGIVIGGRPLITSPLSVVEGISVYGGYSGRPDWRPDPTQVPEFSANEADADGDQVIAGWADGIVLPTGLVNLRLVASFSPTSVGDPDGRTAIGLLARRSPGLVVRDCVLFGLGERGRDGIAGHDGPRPSSPPTAGWRSVLFSGPACSEISAERFGGGGGRAATCFSGIRPHGGDGASGDSAELGYVPGQSGEGVPSGGVGGSQSGPPADGDAHAQPTAPTGPDGIDDAAAWDESRGVFSVALGRGRDGQLGRDGRGGGGGRAGFTSNQTSTSDGVTGCRVGGGGAGGWSIALLAVDSEGLIVRTSTLAGGLPGRGGRGGPGGRGSAGQTGASGGASTGGFDQTGGQDGGDGSDGQNGGRGGDGADGYGVALQCVGPAPRLESVRMVPAFGNQPFQEMRGCAP